MLESRRWLLKKFGFFYKNRRTRYYVSYNKDNSLFNGGGTGEKGSGTFMDLHILFVLQDLSISIFCTDFCVDLLPWRWFYRSFFVLIFHLDFLLLHESATL